ncbi:hypothetical protein EHW67_01700 [Arenibacter aquaticus]|uniref:DUF4136 domain-containing protein n=1 Tax=Arenibacter aquaticus TaxID=2489054 RepID=A0A3S0B169_9FLAO|nr:hypothetical protein [Arenibacter aquaticus]RTE55307.1 hypothetical protein EHW67_01700 [Arenibacter aquaticus]
MKLNRIIVTIISCVWLVSCAPLKPVTTTKNGEIRDYKYIYISQTKSLTSSSGASINGQYYSTSKSVNPRDVISGIMAKEGFILIPELKDEIANETLVINYGESGQRSTGLGSYTIEVTIQFVDYGTSSLISSCTAEGRGETEADDIREAITRCLYSVTLNPTE